MEKILTCIVCPLGCELCIDLEGKEIIEIKGNTCNRGKIYAQNECISPKRTVTSTVKCTDGSLLSVKTDQPIPKEKVFDCMKIINQTTATLPVNIGDVIVKDVFGSNIVATQNKN